MRLDLVFAVLAGIMFGVLVSVSYKLSQIEQIKLALDSCEARIEGILDDAERDKQVGDPGDFDIPPNWLWPNSLSSGGE